MRDWRVSRRFLLRRSVAWYSNSLVLTHAAQQEGRLDPSQSAQLLLVLPLLARREVIISRRFEGRRSRIPGCPVRGGGEATARS